MSQLSLLMTPEERREGKMSRKRFKRVSHTSPSVMPLTALASMELTVSGLFLHLCQWTIPHGYERQYYGDLLRAEGFQADKNGNWYLNIGESATAFMAHLDTVGWEPEPIQIVHDESVPYIVGTNGQTPLGADDRAGLTVILWMVRNKVPGRYCLFAGEEVGCKGSNASLRDVGRWEGVNRAISFDRRGYHSVITHQCGSRTASDEFAGALCSRADELGFDWSPDDTGVFTDSEVFKDLIPECTNISVGYEGQHTCEEWQDLRYLEHLCEAACLIDWEGLPTCRVDEDWREFDWYTGRYINDPLDRFDSYGCGGYRSAYAGDGLSAWDRVEMALELGETPDAEDLKWILEDDAEGAVRLLKAYLHRK